MKKYSLLLVVFAISYAFSQSDANVEDHQVQFGLPIPALLYEKGVAKNATLSLEATLGFQLRGCTGCDTEYGVYPIIRGQYRYYYNMERRLEKKKRIAGNSGNYVGGLLVYQDGNPLLGDLKEGRYVVGGGAVYGIQRTYKGGFFYRLEGGAAFLEDELSSGLALVLAARIGWVLGKNR